MHIVILGAGALGSLFGSRLSRSRARVSLLSTNQSHIRAIRERGLTVEELDGSLSRHEIPAFTDPAQIPQKADLVLVSVKTTMTQKAVRSVLGFCTPSTVFLTLQNGVGNWERISEIVGQGAAIVGVTAQGATLLEDGKIRHGGNGPTVLGEFQGPATERVHAAVQCLVDGGMVAEAGDNMQQLIWQKLMVNVGINAITALTHIRNGQINEIPDARALSRAAVLEALKVASRKGFEFQVDMVERVFAVAEATARNRSSMGQDVDRGRATEIEAINGAIVHYGVELGVAVPVNQTLTQLIHILEFSYGKSSL
jgi:2-dehydropantoate 2-reductase